MKKSRVSFKQMHDTVNETSSQEQHRNTVVDNIDSCRS
jgi:hypothetical protein